VCVCCTGNLNQKGKESESERERERARERKGERVFEVLCVLKCCHRQTLLDVIRSFALTREGMAFCPLLPPKKSKPNFSS